MRGGLPVIEKVETASVHRPGGPERSSVAYAIVTFGCRVNQADSLGFERELRGWGAAAADLERADVVVVNTCSVTAAADQAARQMVRRVARLNPAARIVVTGCSATRRPSDFLGLANVWGLVPNDDKPKLVADLCDRMGIPAPAACSEGDGPCGAVLEPGMGGRTAFMLRVQTGCAEACSYCIIPATRGAPRSAPIAHVLAEVDRLEQAGYKEIVVTGVHLGSYGRDRSPRESLRDLLAALAARPGAAARFRISSLEPMDCTPDIVDLIASSGCFAPHFHLPLQHASDRVLASMRRPYTCASYARLLDLIVRRMPEASIGTDVMVGFPGETDRDFEALCDFLRSSPLAYLHVFPYSDRPGAEATSLPDKVPGAVVRERAAAVRAIGRTLTRAFHERQLGTVHRALTLGNGTTALTGNYLKVAIPPGCAGNEWVTVRVTACGDALAGEVVGARPDQRSAVASR